MTLYSQLDSRWKNELLGFSNVTIGGYGCTITSIGMLLDETPSSVNARMKAVGGFADKNLVIWEKIKEAFPEKVESVRRVWYYDNEDVKANIPCIVQVNGAPIGASMHFVVYVGNHKIYDPWGGVERPTAYYDAQSYCVIKLKPFAQPTIPPVDDCLAKLAEKTELETQLRGVIEQKDDTIKHLGDTIDTKNAEIAVLNTRISGLEQQVLELTSQLGSCQEQSVKVPDLTKQVDSCEKSRAAYMGQVSKLQEQLTKIKNNLVPKKYLSKKIYDLIMTLE